MKVFVFHLEELLPWRQSSFGSTNLEALRSANHTYILDPNLVITVHLDDLAPLDWHNFDKFEYEFLSTYMSF